MASEFQELLRRANALDARRVERIERQKESLDRLTRKLQAVREALLSPEELSRQEILEILDREH